MLAYRFVASFLIQNDQSELQTVPALCCVTVTQQIAWGKRWWHVGKQSCGLTQLWRSLASGTVGISHALPLLLQRGLWPSVSCPSLDQDLRKLITDNKLVILCPDAPCFPQCMCVFFLGDFPAFSSAVFVLLYRQHTHAQTHTQKVFNCCFSLLLQNQENLLTEYKGETVAHITGWSECVCFQIRVTVWA